MLLRKFLAALFSLVAGFGTANAQSPTWVAAPAGAAVRLNLGRPTRALPGFKIEAKHQALRSADARCASSVTYPQVSGLADRGTESSINGFLLAAFKPQRFAAKSSLKDCNKSFMKSTGFSTALIGSGVLSIKRSRLTEGDTGKKSSTVQQCYAIDLSRGALVDFSRELTSVELMKLSNLASSAVSARYRTQDLRTVGLATPDLKLAAGTFSICFMADHLLIPIEAPYLAEQPGFAIEAMIPYTTLTKAMPDSTLARRVSAVKAAH